LSALGYGAVGFFRLESSISIFKSHHSNPNLTQRLCNGYQKTMVTKKIVKSRFQLICRINNII